MTQKITFHTEAPWGIEDTGQKIWIGPIRSDGSGKVSEIVCHFDIEGLTEDAAAKARANAFVIVEGVNSYVKLRAIFVKELIGEWAKK